MQVLKYGSVGIDTTLKGIDIENRDDLLTKTAQKIFSNYYTDLFQIQKNYSHKLLELQEKQLNLKKNCVHYFFNSFCDSESKCFFVSLITGIALFAINVFGILIYGLQSNREALIWGGILGAIASVPISLAAHHFFANLLCTRNTLEEYKNIKQEIQQIQEDKQYLIHLIQFTNAFAKFSKKWTQLTGKEFDDNAVKEIFKKFRVVKKVYHVCLENLVGQDFMRLAPLLLMNKMSELNPASDFAITWKEMIGSSCLWGGEKDKQLWSIVGLKRPSIDIYCDYFQAKFNDFNKPDQWESWFQGKLNAYVSSLKQGQ